MPRRFGPRSGPSSRAITSTGCWRRMPTAALLRPDANGSPHAPQSGRPRNSILCPENPGRYTFIFLVGVVANGPVTGEELRRLSGVLLGLFIGATAGALLFVHAPSYAPVLPFVITLGVVAMATKTFRHRA